MESRAFIRHAQSLISRISNNAVDGVEENHLHLQKEITNLFSGMQNPTLPSASRLCAAALAAGFTVKPEVQNRLAQAESCWE